MGTGRPTSAAGHAEPLAASLDEAVVGPSPRLGLKRDCRLLLCHYIQRRRRATPPLEGQEAIGQEAQRGVVVETGPGTALEVVQPLRLFDLLIPLLYLPAGFPQADSFLQRGRRRQVGQRVANRAIGAPFDQQPTGLSLHVGHVVSAAPSGPAVGWPHAQPGKLGLQRSFGALPPTERGVLELLGQPLDGHWRRGLGGDVPARRWAA